MIYLSYLLCSLVLIMLFRYSAFWIAIVALFVGAHIQVGCATVDRDLATTALITAKAAPTIVDALDLADSAVKAACHAEPASEDACRQAWIAKRDAAAKSVTAILDTLAAARNARGGAPRPRLSHRPKSERRKRDVGKRLRVNHRKLVAVCQAARGKATKDVPSEQG